MVTYTLAFAFIFFLLHQRPFVLHMLIT